MYQLNRQKNEPENIMRFRKTANTLSSMGVFIILAISSISGQEVIWQNNGKFNYDSHFSRNSPPVRFDQITKTHPGYSVINGKPSSMKFRISGMEFLSTGELVLADLNGSGAHFGSNGSIELWTGAMGDPESIKRTVISKDVWMPLGLVVTENDDIYYLAQDGIWLLQKSAGGGEWTKSLFSPVAKPTKMKPDAGGHGPTAFNLKLHNGYFYYSIGGYHNLNYPDNEGYVVKVSRADKSVEILARGIRMPNGLGITRAGEIFITDNQGEWRPANPVYHIVKGKHYQWPQLPPGGSKLPDDWKRWTALPSRDIQQSPAVWIPYKPVGGSLTNMHLIKQGPYRDQFLIGDNRIGVVHRVSVEEVGGQYQGANYIFTGILDAGVQSFTEVSDGTIFGGSAGIPHTGWAVLGKQFGLAKWKPNEKAFFDIHSITSNNSGFDISFTQSAKLSEIIPDNFWVRSFHYGEPTQKYGGSPIDMRNEKITKITLSPDKKSIALDIANLQPGRVYDFNFHAKVVSETGEKLWNTYAWYTLNKINSRAPLIALKVNEPAQRGYEVFKSLNVAGLQFTLDIPVGGTWDLTLTDIKGKVHTQARLKGRDRFSYTVPHQGVYFIKLMNNTEHTFQKKITLGF